MSVDVKSGEDRTKKSIIELTRCTVADYTRMRKLPVAVLADNVRSMHNVGSILRTADAFLMEEVILAGITGRPPHPEISKTALGAEESVKWRHVDDAVAEVVSMREKGWKICVLEQTHNSIELQAFQPSTDCRWLLVAGNEVEGVDQRIVDMADVVIEIPQCGVKHSLNVSVSAGIAMWHIFSALRR